MRQSSGVSCLFGVGAGGAGAGAISGGVICSIFLILLVSGTGMLSGKMETALDGMAAGSAVT